MTQPLSSARVATQLRVPITIFVRYENLTESFRSGEYRARAEIYAENRTEAIEVEGQKVPLEYWPTASRIRISGISRFPVFEAVIWRSPTMGW